MSGVQLAWATDIHLEFLSPAALKDFVVHLAHSPADGFLLGGDLSQSQTLASHLRVLDRALQRPIYFVLGNHDYYNGGVEEVRAEVRALAAHSEMLHWLSESDVVSLSSETALVGHDGWADGRNGDYANSPVMLNDYRLIADFAGRDPGQRLARLQQLAEEARTHLARVLPAALRSHRRVLVLTHVPPFAEAAWHKGRMSDDDWLPHFSSRVVGEELLRLAAAHPGTDIRVLCGHTHSSGEYAPLPNLRVTTGGARYGEPQVQELIAA